MTHTSVLDAIHIGINDYPGSGSDLSGCVNDANDRRETLEAREFQTTSLLDSEASKGNMVEVISEIVGDTGRDEALCPHDITQGHILTGDELYEILGERKRGARGLK